MYHPGFGEVGNSGYIAEDTRREFIELYNPGSAPVNMSGWRIKGGVTFRFPAVSIPSHGYLLVTADADINRFITTYQSVYSAITNGPVLGGWSRTLSNRGESLELENYQGQRIDYVPYSTEGDWANLRPGNPYPGQPTWWNGWRWVTGADGGGKSLERIHWNLSASLAQNWQASSNEYGTPGGPNSGAKAEMAPLILEVKHFPPVPKSSDLVTITARIIILQADPVSVRLYYRLDGASEFSVSPMNLISSLEEGIYGVVLPPQPDQSVVEFYVMAESEDHMKRTWPGPSDDQGTQGANASYQVDNSAYTGSQPFYRLVITQADWLAWSHLMDSVPGGRYSNAKMNATFISTDMEGTEVRYNVLVRNRGAGTRAAHPHNLEIQFPADRPWKGLADLALNTRTLHSQAAGDAINVLAGLPSTSGYPVQLRINGKNLANLAPTGGINSYQFGSYYAFQPYGSDWLESRLPDDSEGNLYKGVWYLDYQPLSHAANLAYLGEDPAAYRLAYSPAGPSASSGPYAKQNNTAEDDWSDLINLCRVLNQTPDSNYLEQVSQVVHIDEWLNYFAVTSLIGNRETTFGTGAGDDYSLYRGVLDPRFLILPHDMDTVLGQGDASPKLDQSIFVACNISVVNRFLKHPAIAPRYYAILKRQADTTFSPNQINRLLDQVLGNWVPEPYIASMKDFAALRRTNVLRQIPAGLSMVTTLPVIDGLLVASNGTVSLGGQAPAIHTRSVLVNGQSARWTAWSARWTVDNLALNPGINRVVVQAIDAAGREIERSSTDIWLDSGPSSIVSIPVLAENTTWSKAQSPYRVAENLTIPANLTLTIEPAVTVFFDSGAGLLIQGKVVARGNEHQRIRFTRWPGSSHRWTGFQFHDSRQSNVMAYADIEYADARDSVFSISNSQVLLDHITIANCDTMSIDVKNPRTTIRHSTFGHAGSHSIISVEGMPSDGWFILDGNLFGAGQGDQDLLRFHQASQPGGAMAQVLDNVFLGNRGNILGLHQTDALMEGNLFMRAGFGKSTQNASAAIAADPAGGESSAQNGQRLTLARNVFFENDYALLSKMGVHWEISHSVFAGNHGALLLQDSIESGAVRKVHVENCIFWNNHPENEGEASGAIVGSLDGGSLITVNHSLLPAVFHPLGSGNREADPQFVRPGTSLILSPVMPRFSTGFEGFNSSPDLIENGAFPDMHLLPGSPAIASGLNGVDMGAYASTHVTPPHQIRLNEILAHNVTAVSAHGGFPDLVELYNPGLQTVSLEGMALSDSFLHGHKYIFPPGLQLDPGQYLVVFADNQTNQPGVHLGFGMEASGDAIYLLAPSGDVLDSVSFGMQVQDLSIGRIADGSWALTQPTLGSPNRIQMLGEARNLRINEWMANPASGDDWLELYNSEDNPVALGGLFLTDDLARPTLSVIPPLSFIGGGTNGFVRIIADGDAVRGAHHANFKLSSSGEEIGLFSARLVLIDQAAFGPQSPDVSQGRFPDGSSNIVAFINAATPGRPNTSPQPDLDTDGDAVPDSWELAYGLNPNDPRDASLDNDGDGLLNLEEYRAATDPRNPSSSLSVKATLLPDKSIQLQFQAMPGKDYTVQYRDSLGGSSWLPLQSVPASPEARAVTITHPAAATLQTRYFRVMLSKAGL